jgi:Domain of unknown function (DUF4258)
VRITYLPHARRRMGERDISEDEARATLEEPDAEYPGNLGRTVAERTFPSKRLATKVVYNRGAEDERVVVTVERGRPRGGEPS